MATTMKCGWRVERGSVIVDVNIQEGKREVGSFEALPQPQVTSDCVIRTCGCNPQARRR